MVDGDVRPAVLVRRLSAQLLARLPELTERLVATIAASDPAYDHLSEERYADVHASCHDNLQRILQVLAERLPAGADRYDAPHATGTRRAAQGVPLEAVLHAFRLGGRVIWEGMAEGARAGGAPTIDALLDAATSVWEIVDRYSGAVGDAYRQHELELVRVGDERRHAALDAILDGQGTDAAVAREAEQVLALPADSALAVLACRPGVRVPPWLRAASAALSARGLRSLWRPRADGTVALLVLGEREPAGLAALLAGCGATHGAALSPRVVGVAAVGEAHRLARAGLATLPPGSEGVVTFEQRLVPALLVQDAALADRLTAAALGPVLDLAEPDRGLLLETLSAWLDCGGSASRAAERLFCHRNTVLNRLRRLEALTGRSVDRPRELVELTLALMRCQLTGPAPVQPAPQVLPQSPPPGGVAAPR